MSSEALELDSVPVRIAEAIQLRRGEVSIIYPFFLLNRSGKICWDLIDGKRTVSQICEEFIRSCGSLNNKEKVILDVMNFLVRLKELKLIKLERV
jgi:hypothetical protein